MTSWSRVLQRIGPQRLQRWEELLYVVFAGSCVLFVAGAFVGSMQSQIGLLYASMPEGAVRDALRRLGPWSAPLDDVFIHFDFARSIARGAPFQWLDGQGYSSGGTSISYPFVLAAGYWAGFRGLWLMQFALALGCTATVALLIAARRLLVDLPRWTHYLLPPTLLSVGALSWSLFSGMEVAYFLAFWGWAYVAWDAAWRRAETETKLGWLPAGMGATGLLLVLARPEAAVLVAIFALSLGAKLWPRYGARRTLLQVVLIGLPGAVAVITQATANRLLTGEFGAAGALAKLELHHPYLTSRDVVEAWWFHLRYQLFRVTEHHFGSVIWSGYAPWVLAIPALYHRATRRPALLLLSSAVIWSMVVALNGQVRWQNERYAMPATAWVLLLAAMGLAVLLSRPLREFWPWRKATNSPWYLERAVPIVLALSLTGTFAWFQRGPYRDQLWFYGRASRNILEQHVQTGLLLRHGIRPPPRAVLLSDAGAIPYIADLPAVDLIGLGGYHRLPFAEATRLGVAGGLELIEGMSPELRPDFMALYPSWWSDLPLWFGQRIADVPVTGNVICGGAADVIYRADWTAMTDSAAPSLPLARGSQVVAEVDFADVRSEQAAALRFPRGIGFVSMKLLPHPLSPDRDLWDAGRALPPQLPLPFQLDGLKPHAPLELRLRTAPPRSARLLVYVDGQALPPVPVPRTDGWKELSIAIPAELVRSSMKLEFRVEEEELVLFHLWALQAP